MPRTLVYMRPDDTVRMVRGGDAEVALLRSRVEGQKCTVLADHADTTAALMDAVDGLADVYPDKDSDELAGMIVEEQLTA